MATTITRLFDSYDDARRAVNELEASGISHDRISLVANNAGDRYNADNRYGDTGMTGTTTATTGATSTSTGLTTGDPEQGAETGAGTGATLGTVLGGGAGLLAGIGSLAIPGVGPIIAAGWLIATLTGAGVGAAAGGLLGSLVGAGVNEADANVYAEGVRRGGTLVSVRADEPEVARIEQVLAKYAPVDVTSRGSDYRASGWTRFDEAAPAYDASTPGTMGTAGASTLGTATMPVSGSGTGSSRL